MTIDEHLPTYLPTYLVPIYLGRTPFPPSLYAGQDDDLEAVQTTLIDGYQDTYISRRDNLSWNSITQPRLFFDMNVDVDVDVDVGELDQIA